MMPSFKLCSDDPVVSELRDVFKANILRIPEERVAPLTVLITSKKGVRFVGGVGDLLAPPSFTLDPTDILESDMAALTNRRSRLLDGEVGVQILSGLLNGLGNGSGPDISAHFKDLKAFRFNFPSIKRRYVAIGRIGHLLAGRPFDRSNLLFKTLLDPQVTLRLVDSVITSAGFEIDAGDDAESNLKVDGVALQKALANAKINVSSKGSKQVSFQSKRRLAFAFTCVTVALASDGSIRSIAPSTDKVGPPQLRDPKTPDRGQEEHVLLTRDPALIDLVMQS